MKICVLVGNPKPDSRTLTLAERLAAMIGDEHSDDQISTIDLALHACSIFTWPSEELNALSNEVAQSDLVLVASPTYKATYTGLLKAFLDRYPNLGLRSVSAIPIMTGGDSRHSMAPDVYLRTLLVELGASLPTRALYFETSEMDRLDEILATWFEINRAEIAQIRSTAAHRHESRRAIDA